MAKRGLFVLILAAFVAGGAFAQIDISFGGGALIDWSRNNGTRWSYSETGLSLNGTEGMHLTSFGAFAFVDVTYAVFDVSLAYGSARSYYTFSTNQTGVPNESYNVNGGSMMQLGFSLMGKFPVFMGGFTVFPLAGFNYNVVLSTRDDKGDKDDWGTESAAEWLSQFGLLLGGGLDFPIDNNLFFRGEALLQFRFSSKASRDGISIGGDYMSLSDANKLPGVSANTTVGWGPRIKIGVGYRL
jgi:hypothetical protein